MSAPAALLNIRKDAFQPVLGAGDGRIPFIRLLVWLSAAGGSMLFYPQQNAWPVACIAAALTLPSLLALRHPFWQRILALAGLAVDVVAASLLILRTGGFSSPFAALYFVTTGEALVLFSARGAVLAALAASALGLANLHPGVDARAAAGYGLASGLLLLASVLLGAAGRNPGLRPATVLRPRTVEEVERQLALLAEDHHRLKATYRETAAIARAQKGQIADLTLVRDALTSAWTAPTAEEGMGRLLRAAASAVDAPWAALWLSAGDEPLLCLWAHKGPVAASLLWNPIRLDDGTPPSALRSECEQRLSLAAPRSCVPKDGAGEGSDAGQDGPVAVHSLLLRTPERILGILAVARPSPFQNEDAARAEWLAGHLVPAISGLLAAHRLELQTRRAEGCRMVCEALASCRSLGEWCSALATAARSMTGAQHVTVFAVDTLSGRLVPRASLGGVVNPADHLDLGIGTGVSGWVATRQRRILVPDLAAQKDLAGLNLVPPSVRSFLAVPVVYGGVAVGAVSVAHEQPHAFGAADAEALERAAQIAAPVVARFCGLTLAAHLPGPSSI